MKMLLVPLSVEKGFSSLSSWTTLQESTEIDSDAKIDELPEEQPVPPKLVKLHQMRPIKSTPTCTSQLVIVQSRAPSSTSASGSSTMGFSKDTGQFDSASEVYHSTPPTSTASHETGQSTNKQSKGPKIVPDGKTTSVLHLSSALDTVHAFESVPDQHQTPTPQVSTPGTVDGNADQGAGIIMLNLRHLFEAAQLTSSSNGQPASFAKSTKSRKDHLSHLMEEIFGAERQKPQNVSPYLLYLHEHLVLTIQIQQTTSQGTKSQGSSTSIQMNDLSRGSKRPLDVPATVNSKKRPRLEDTTAVDTIEEDLLTTWVFKLNQLIKGKVTLHKPASSLC
ncbi:hypothetical protein DXG01_005642 [Tephrocybe rancida]|nr:hypothetical protein DXG01_005642 [Tephrocybe rancida]